MSVSDLPTRPDVSEPTPAPATRNRGAVVYVVAICALFVASGLVRWRQDRRISQGLRQGLAQVVPLERIPLVLGAWSGVDTQLDPQIARGTGADKVVTRCYTNRNTGVSIDVIILFGPAYHMYIHSPEICYPKAGFAIFESPAPRTVRLPASGARGGGDPAGAAVPFLAAVYAKGEGAQADLQEVYWTWRYQDRWTPQVLKPKQIERIPTMIKVHTSRSVLRGERRDANNPNEAFLRVLVPEIERLLSSPASSPTT
jgi:Protein of unknown function (DUF3485)